MNHKFALLQAGFTYACLVTLAAVGSYSTFSPLPTKSRRLFSAALSKTHVSQVLPGAFIPGARTFLYALT
tara:strand:- start:2497 stop:2706 length:210 start_codon:yes stop_codon:yes gene_type:complete